MQTDLVRKWKCCSIFHQQIRFVKKKKSLNRGYTRRTSTLYYSIYFVLWVKCLDVWGIQRHLVVILENRFPKKEYKACHKIDYSAVSHSLLTLKLPLFIQRFVCLVLFEEDRYFLTFSWEKVTPSGNVLVTQPSMLCLQFKHVWTFCLSIT